MWEIYETTQFKRQKRRKAWTISHKSKMIVKLFFIIYGSLTVLAVILLWISESSRWKVKDEKKKSELSRSRERIKRNYNYNYN